jgi:hypothetical protein
MKKKIILIFVLIGVTIFLLNIWYFNSNRIDDVKREIRTERIVANSYMEYNPIVYQQNHLIDVPELLTQEHVKNVIKSIWAGSLNSECNFAFFLFLFLYALGIEAVSFLFFL